MNINEFTGLTSNSPLAISRANKRCGEQAGSQIREDRSHPVSENHVTMPLRANTRTRAALQSPCDAEERKMLTTP